MNVPISFATLLVAGALFALPSPVQAQFGHCDDCSYVFDDPQHPEEGGFAVCVFGGGGPLVGCYQVNEGFCSSEGFCFQQQMTSVSAFGGVLGSRSVVGDVNSVERRSCDSSAVLRTYTVMEATTRREALRRIVV